MFNTLGNLVEISMDWIKEKKTKMKSYISAQLNAVQGNAMQWNMISSAVWSKQARVNFQR